MMSNAKVHLYKKEIWQIRCQTSKHIITYTCESYFYETCNIVVDLESDVFVRVVFMNKPNLTNILSNSKIHFYKKTNMTNMMSNLKAYFYLYYKSYF